METKKIGKFTVSKNGYSVTIQQDGEKYRWEEQLPLSQEATQRLWSYLNYRTKKVVESNMLLTAIQKILG